MSKAPERPSICPRENCGLTYITKYGFHNNKQQYKCPNGHIFLAANDYQIKLNPHINLNPNSHLNCLSNKGGKCKIWKSKLDKKTAEQTGEKRYYCKNHDVYFSGINEDEMEVAANYNILTTNTADTQNNDPTIATTDNDSIGQVIFTIGNPNLHIHPTLYLRTNELPHEDYSHNYNLRTNGLPYNDHNYARNNELMTTDNNVTDFSSYLNITDYNEDHETKSTATTNNIVEEDHNAEVSSEITDTTNINKDETPTTEITLENIEADNLNFQDFLQDNPDNGTIIALLLEWQTEQDLKNNTQESNIITTQNSTTNNGNVTIDELKNYLKELFTNDGHLEAAPSNDNVDYIMEDEFLINMQEADMNDEPFLHTTFNNATFNELLLNYPEEINTNQEVDIPETNEENNFNTILNLNLPEQTTTNLYLDTLEAPNLLQDNDLFPMSLFPDQNYG